MVGGLTMAENRESSSRLNHAAAPGISLPGARAASILDNYHR
jgi:hypothetical protein